MVTTSAFALVAGLAFSLPGPAGADSPVSGRALKAPEVVSFTHMAALDRAAVAYKPAGRVLNMIPELKVPGIGESKVKAATLGGGNAPKSAAVQGGGGAQGFPGVDIVGQETAGRGAYSGAGFGLEPPDQALCVGNGYVIEGVNQAFQIFTTRGVALSPPVLIDQFYNAPLQTALTNAVFLSDPKCIYDSVSKRFFVTVLEIDEAAPNTFSRSHNYLAVSATSNPMGKWYLYKDFDITDDGQNGTPLHPTCPCLGDQPLIGVDANGFYISTNEYSYAELLPAAPPPAVAPLVYRAFTLPDFRNGQAQVYALSKQKLISGQSVAVTQFDTSTVPLPAGTSTTSGYLWSSLQPSFSPPGDATTKPASGVEYFLSQLDFATTGDNRVAVWALTNTASLNSAGPDLKLVNAIITTLNPADTYTYPKSADQKIGSVHPIADACLPAPCAEVKLNANDDRMNQVMLTNGNLWSGVNTMLPAINAAGSGQDADPRAGIMYFQVRPSMSGGKLSATMVRDGYVIVPRQNVIFPSIGATPRGSVLMSFTLTGVDHFPSSAWAQLDGLAAGKAPTVHIAAEGKAPDDGFTGYCADVGLGGVTNVGGLCTDGIARWGDYSASVVDESGCVWSGTEFISGSPGDGGAGNWSTYVNRIPTPGCTEPPLTPKPWLNLNPCLPTFTAASGDDNFEGAGAFKGQNPQMDIVAGNLKLSKDKKMLVTTLTLKNLSKAAGKPGGQGNEYYFIWTFNGTQWFSHVSVSTTGTVTYTDGQISGNTYGDRKGSSDVGSFNQGPKGTVVVNVPLDKVGGSKVGQILTQPNGQTKEIFGILLAPVDNASAQYDYRVGQLCIAGVTKPVKIPPKVLGTKQTRPLAATGVDDRRSYVLGLLLMAAAAAVVYRIRRSR